MAAPGPASPSTPSPPSPPPPTGDEENAGDSGLTRSIKGVTRILTDGYYGATYIPDHSDPLGTAVTEAVRHGPIFLALRDVWTCATMFALFPGVLTPFWTPEPQHEFYLGWGKNMLGMFIVSFASIFEVVLLLLCIPTFVFLPGPSAIVLFATGKFLIRLICFPIQGPSKVWSKPPTSPEMIAKHERNSGERWFFLNGCCVTGYNLQQNVDLLSDTFGRPIFAIHNRTYGVLGDLFECILQRSFNLFTEETRVCYEYVKAYLTDPNVKKVVLIAHSQGSIMASQILDQLYLDLPAQLIAKLEIYTFGNAAAHFNNPLRKLVTQPSSTDSDDETTTERRDSAVFTSPSRKPSLKDVVDVVMGRKPYLSEMLPERVVTHIEHYCNSQDMVTRWGALFSARSILQNRFCGHIFINEEASGHMLNQHYLSEMFPLPGQKYATDTHSGTTSKAHRSGIPFLDRVVRLDTATITQRNSTAIHQLAVMRHDSAPNDQSDHTHIANKASVDDVHNVASRAEHKELQLTLGEGTKLTSKDLSGAEGSRISVVRACQAAEELQGRTVRQLSRLWRYMDGADPDELLSRVLSPAPST